jgi:hypothetical protein
MQVVAPWTVAPGGERGAQPVLKRFHEGFALLGTNPLGGPRQPVFIRVDRCSSVVKPQFYGPLKMGAWSLEFYWMLEVGAWMFPHLRSVAKWLLFRFLGMVVLPKCVVHWPSIAAARK